MSADSPKIDMLSVPDFIGVPSLSHDLVDVKIAGVHLRIPRNFLESARLGKRYGDEPDSRPAALLKIMTTFPEFTGATEQTMRCYQPLGSCLRKLVTVFTLEGNTDINLRRAPAVAAAAQVSNVGQSELVKVDAQVSLVPSDIFVSYRGTVEKSVVVECFRDEIEKPATSCRVYLNFEGIPMLYQFHRILLPHWRVINDGILQMLASFYSGKVQ